MSDSRAALFQAVLDRPGEDAPRFAYAAYCDAQGDPYGAFIRAQLAWTEGLRSASQDTWKHHRDAQDLLAQNKRGAAWTNGVDKLVPDARFLRGFIDKVLVEAESYFKHADELFRRAPIRQISLSKVGTLVHDLARDPRLTRVAVLAISGKPTIGDAGLEALAASPYLRGLRALDVSDQNISVAGLEALCASTNLPALVYTNLTGNRFEDPIEGYGVDWVTGRPDLNGAYLPPFGKELEAKYGKLPWLYAPSRLPNYPPLDAEL